jgi:FtsP/CotA-like multicopper oxidase with cupredoxin domain
MNRNQRIALIVAAVAVAVIAFVIASPGDDDDSGGTTNTTAAETTGGGGGGTDATATTEAPPKPDVERIVIKNFEVQGGVRNIDVKKGDDVRIVVTSDQPDEIHLHGYDIEKEVAPGKPGNFRFKADVEGVFEIESHTNEDAGKPPLVAKLVVEPS